MTVYLFNISRSGKGILYQVSVPHTLWQSPILPTVKPLLEAVQRFVMVVVILAKQGW